ncbi:sortase [Nesterenkonia sp. CF4.4]|uniref:sortase n=1 Tax=Nesterenkonia sp. CF4.4 TaxID=3373079 RepID=UPI003EE55E16
MLHGVELGEGDLFSLEVFGENLAYGGDPRTQVLEPDETESLYREAGRDLVTLVTCTPLGLNTHRILVTAERTFEEYDAPKFSPWESFDLPMHGWALILSPALLLQIICLRRTTAKQAGGSVKIADTRR